MAIRHGSPVDARDSRYGLNWSLRGEYNWRDDANVGSNINANPQGIQEAFGMLNLRAFIGSDDGGWKLSGYVENLSFEACCTRMVEAPLGGPLRAIYAATNTSVIFCNLGTPRTWGFELEYRFN